MKEVDNNQMTIDEAIAAATQNKSTQEPKRPLRRLPKSHM